LNSVTLSWLPPQQNTDGSPLTNLSGYRIYYGTDASAPSEVISVANPGLTVYVVDNLSPGTYYFVVKAYNSAGVESPDSGIASTTIS
jgi:hypothetical protein